MTVKTVDAGKRENMKPYSENTGKKLADIKHNIKAKKERSNGPPSKVVVRRLPPTMTEEEFIETIMPVPDHDYFMFCPADNSLGPNAFTRAYINFKSPSDIFTFRDKFDGYVFVDQKGNEYPAMVEFAPFQKIPKRIGNKKKDARCGTIDQDQDYLEFLDAVANPETVTLQPLEAVLEEIQAHDRELKANNGYLKIKTPLLEFIEQKKAEKLRSKEEKREERRRKEFERKRAKEEEKRKKKEVKEQKEMKKKDDQKEDILGVKLQVLQPERGKDDGQGDVRQTRKERERERYERERQRRMEEDQQRREREKERAKFTRRDKEKEREERIRRQEEKYRLREEERIRQKEEGREERNRYKDEGRDDRMRHRDEGRDDRARYRDEGRDDRTRHRDDGKDYRGQYRDEGREDQSKHKDEGRCREEVRDDRTRHREEEREEHHKCKEEGREERVKYKDEMREEGTQEGYRLHKSEGVRSKRYSEGRRKDEKDRRIKEERGKKYEDVQKVKIVEEHGAPAEPEDQQRADSNNREEGDVPVELLPEKTTTQKKREKDPRVERRIRNKDRPAMALYRPGQSRLSSRMRNEREEGVDTSSSSPSPVMLDNKKSAPSKKKGASSQKQEAAGGHSDSPSATDTQKEDFSAMQRDSGGEEVSRDDGFNSQ